MMTKSTFKLAVGSVLLATGIILGGCNNLVDSTPSGTNRDFADELPGADDSSAAGSSLDRATGCRPQTAEEREQFIQSLKAAGITVEIGAEKSGLPPTEAALPSSYMAPVTGTRPTQGPHGTCWCFAAAAAYESNHKKHGTSVDVSEESILDQALIGNEAGGFLEDAYYVMLVPGMARQSDYPYQGTKTSMPWGIDKPYRAWLFGWVEYPNMIASRAKIKQAIFDHGAVGTCIVSDYAFNHHRGTGVFSADAGNVAINHAIAIVGWDDAKGAWRVKNSHGPTWGDNGFGWVKYGTSKIGFDSSYVEALQ